MDTGRVVTGRAGLGGGDLGEGGGGIVPGNRCWRGKGHRADRGHFFTHLPAVPPPGFALL